MSNTSVIIANYNGKKYLEDCLGSLKRQTYKDFEVIVSDNASTDGSADYLRKYHPDIKLVENKSNLGFAGANNEALKEAQGEYILCLNNDTRLDKNCLELLHGKLISDDSIGVAFSKLLMMSEPDKLDTVGSYLSSFGFLHHVGFMEKDEGQYDNLKEIFSPKGVCFLIRRSLIEKIGFFDERYFSYFEESDFFWRVWLFGRTINFEPKAIVYHKIGGTCTRMASAFIDFHSFKNRIATLIKNLSFGNLVWMLPVHICICLVLSIIYLFRLRPANTGAILRAIWWNIASLGASLKKRKQVQKEIRQVSDKELFGHIKKDVSLKKWWAFTKVYLKRW